MGGVALSSTLIASPHFPALSIALLAPAASMHQHSGALRSLLLLPGVLVSPHHPLPTHLQIHLPWSSGRFLPKRTHLHLLPCVVCIVIADDINNVNLDFISSSSLQVTSQPASPPFDSFGKLVLAQGERPPSSPDASWRHPLEPPRQTSDMCKRVSSFACPALARPRLALPCIVLSRYSWPIPQSHFS